jgi:peptide/nickel transport system substrate-binding protein
MFRGFRWQLLALVVAIILFAVSVTARFLDIASDDTPEATQPPLTSVAPTPEPTSVDFVNVPTSIVPAQTEDIITFREGLQGNVQRLNPLFARFNVVDSDITSLIFEGLTRINGYGEVVPALAVDWVVSFDGLEYMVTLRDDVLWQDGTPFTAADVVYTVSVLGSPDFPGPPELGDFWRTVEVEQIDDYLVRFRLVQQLASFPEALRIGILPYHALQGTTASQLAAHPFNLTPVGTGPYQLEAIRANGNAIYQVDLRVSPVYRQRPEGASGYALERLSFHLYDSLDDVLAALSAEEIDAYSTAEPSERLSILGAAGDFVVQTTYQPTVGILIFNWVNEDLTVFREQRVRQALARGLDRTSLIERQMLNTAVLANSPLLPLSWAYDYGQGETVWAGYDLAAARELLSTVRIGSAPNESDDTQPVSDVLFEFSILTMDDPVLMSVAQEVAAQWEQLNLRVTVEAVNDETYQSRLESGRFDVALVELSTGGGADPDVYAFWHQAQYPDGKNYGGANDRIISESLERARRDVNGLHRASYYSDFQREFVARVIGIPLYYPLFSYAVSTSVTGVQLGFLGSPSDRFMTIADWSKVE